MLRRTIVGAIRRLPARGKYGNRQSKLSGRLSPKHGNVSYNKGKGGRSVGRRTAKGAFVLNKKKLTEIVLPKQMGEDFPLKAELFSGALSRLQNDVADAKNAIQVQMTRALGLTSELKLCEKRLSEATGESEQASSRLERLKGISSTINKACSFFQRWAQRAREMDEQARALLKNLARARRKEKYEALSDCMSLLRDEKILHVGAGCEARAAQILQGHDEAAGRLMEPDELGRSQSHADVAADRNRRVEKALAKITSPGSFHCESQMPSGAMAALLRERDAHLQLVPEEFALETLIGEFTVFRDEFSDEFKAGYFAQGLAKVCAPLVSSTMIGWTPGDEDALSSLGWRDSLQGTPFLQSILSDVVMERVAWYAREIWDPSSPPSSTQMAAVLGSLAQLTNETGTASAFIVDSFRREAESLCHFRIMGVDARPRGVEKAEQWTRSSSFALLRSCQELIGMLSMDEMLPIVDTLLVKTDGLPRDSDEAALRQFFLNMKNEMKMKMKK
eukprot:g2838.t1